MYIACLVNFGQIGVNSSVKMANKASVAFVLGESGVCNGDGSGLQESDRRLKSSELEVSW